jgi:hypothetical protein
MGHHARATGRADLRLFGPASIAVGVFSAFYQTYSRFDPVPAGFTTQAQSSGSHPSTFGGAKPLHGQPGGSDGARGGAS